jgi:hypothetical protein
VRRDQPGGKVAVRSAQVIHKAGRKLLTSLWDMCATADPRIGRLYAPDSPAAAMHTMFGAAGPLRAIGVAPHDRPQAWGAAASEKARGGADMFIMDGTLDSASRQYGFQVGWQFVGENALIAEIAPFHGAWWPNLPDARMLQYFAVAHGLDRAIPDSRAKLDRVAAAIWRVASVYGLSLTLRALAAWWRLADGPDVAARYSPPVVAAAIVRAVGYRAGANGRYDDAAARFRVDVDAVRTAAGDVQRRLALSATRPW